MTAVALSLLVFIFCLFYCRLLDSVQFCDDAFHMRVYLLICENLLGGVHEQDVDAFLALYLMLEVSPTFADAAFQKVAFDSPLEEFFRDGYEYAAVLLTIVEKISVAQCTYAAMPATGKKSFDAFLAVQSF